MRVIVANSVGRLDDGRETILFPSRCDAAVGGKSWDYYPYELAYLSSLLKREGFDAIMIDGCRERLGADAYAERLIALRPDVIVTECSAMTYGAMTRAAVMTKAATGARLILTGPFGTWQPERAKADGWDIVIGGEYEAKVLAALNEQPEPAGYIDLDWLPWPEDNDIYRCDYSECSDPLPGMIQLYPTRGCPMPCVFCVAPTYYGGHGNNKHSHRTRDVDNVCDEIEYLGGRYPQMNGCFFNEENHSTNIKWLETFAHRLIERGLNRYRYDAMCGYWTFTPALIELLAQAGYLQLRVGIENIDPAVGRAVHKITHVERVEAFMGWCKANGIRVYGTFQMGAPGSTADSDKATMDKRAEWMARGLLQASQVSVSQPQPGTPLYEMAVREGALVGGDFEKFDFYSRNLRWQK